MRSKAHTALTAPLVLHHTRIYKRATKKIILNVQMRNKPFLILIYHSSQVKAATNAARVCKLRNGVKKPLNFFFFHWPKA
jgi:ketopantoate hydroxymethyltransferase